MDDAEDELPAAQRPPSRLARWATISLWPVAVAVPVLPLVLAAPLRAVGSAAGDDTAFLVQLAALESIVLLATVCGARLVGVRMRRAGEATVTRHESWAVLALALGGIVATAGLAATAAGIPFASVNALVDGTWAVLVAAGALVVLPLRELRRMTRGEHA